MTAWELTESDGSLRLGFSVDNERGLRTLITDFVEVSRMRGNATKGRTTDKTTCDATSRLLMPERPTETAITRDGTRPIIRVMIRRKKGWMVRYLSHWLKEIKWFNLQRLSIR